MLSKHLAAKRAHGLALIFLGALALICLRLWYLAVVCHESFEERAGRPRVRSEVVLAERGAICDRFGLPLASNELSFEIAVRYSDIQNAPLRHLFFGAAATNRQISFSRAQYVEALSALIAHHCELSAKQIKDQILAKAALTPALFVSVVANIPYREFAALKLKSIGWPGLHPKVVSRRIYPFGTAGCHVLGHMGMVDEAQLRTIDAEMRSIASLLEIEENWLDRQMLQERLKELQSQYQRRSDRVGKAGLEKHMESYLKGIHGSSLFEVDAKGRSLRRLVEGNKAVEHGRCLDLSLSVQLQQFAESLLARSEGMREQALQRGRWPMPWIKGGAIAALDPKTGEILALASSPKFDPNDFSGSLMPSQKNQMARWVESAEYLGSIWDGLQPLQRRVSDEKLIDCEEKRYLSWPLFLDLACSQRDHLTSLLCGVSSIGEAFALCRAFGQVQTACKNLDLINARPSAADNQMMINDLYPEPNFILWGSTADLSLRKALQKSDDVQAALVICDRYFKSIERNDHKLLLLDLLRLLIDEDKVSTSFERCNVSIKDHKEHAQAFCRLKLKSQKIAQQWFDQGPFDKWRVDHQRYLIAARRLQEQDQKRPTRPFTFYIDEERRRQFDEFWANSSIDLLTQLAMPASNQNEPCHQRGHLDLMGRLAQALNQNDDLLMLQRVCAGLVTCEDRELALAYLHSFRPFSQLNRPLLSRYPALGRAKVQKESDLAISFRPRGGFGYMRSLAWRNASAQGSIFKLVIAYEALRRRWTPLCRYEQLNPLIMWDFVRQQNGRTFVGADQSGRLIRQLHSGGRLPRSSRAEIGKIDLIGAITSSSNPYFSLLASEEILLEDLQMGIAQFGFGQLTGVELPGEVAGNIPDDLSRNKTGLYNLAIGQHALTVTPLQTARMLAALGNGGELIAPRIVKIKTSNEPSRGLFMPPEIRAILLEGMHRVSYSPQGCASTSAIRTFAKEESAMRAYRSLKGQFVGKTSTAEVDEWTSIASHRPERCSHIWFGGISFGSKDKSWTDPELVVVVFLPHGTFGKEAAPIAAQMVAKWREIKGSKT